MENRKFSRGEICAAFGVPEEIVTTTDTAKYDVMQGARLNFIENRVAPLCRRLEAEEEAVVRSIDPRAVGWFDLESLPILQNARRNRLASAKTGFEMGVPFNELNRVLDLGFKPLPWGDLGWVAGNLKVAGAEGKPAGDPNAEVDANPDPELARETDRPAIGPEANERKLRRRKLSRFLFEQRGRILSRVAEVFKAGAAMVGGALSLHVSEVLPAELEAAEAERLRAWLKPWAGAESDAAEFNHDTFAALRETLTAGTAAKETSEQLIERVKEIFNHR